MVFPLSIQMTSAHTCENILGQWNGHWDDLQKIHPAWIQFSSIQDEQFKGEYSLDSGITNPLNGTCTLENSNTEFLVFERVPPYFNPCYGQLITEVLTIWCIDPAQSGSFTRAH